MRVVAFILVVAVALATVVWRSRRRTSAQLTVAEYSDGDLAKLRAAAPGSVTTDLATSKTTIYLTPQQIAEILRGHS